MAMKLSEEEAKNGILEASAGNHAQGGSTCSIVKRNQIEKFSNKTQYISCKTNNVHDTKPS
jgi:hypothetical protein